MAKVVCLKFERGDFNQGFKVVLDIAEEGRFPHVIGVSGALRRAPEIPKFYQDWQTKYYRLESNYRKSRLFLLEVDAASQDDRQVEQVSSIQECLAAAEQLKLGFQNWLKCEEFRPIEEELLSDLSKFEDVRIILQTKDEQLRKLPWETWSFFQRFSKADLGLSPPLAHGQRSHFNSRVVKILAILGNSDGINIQSDRAILDNLPFAEVCFLVEPTREQFNLLWKDTWDVLFFAGHSSSQDGQKGYIHLNRLKDGSLEIGELAETLKAAIANGLKLAIFNSCDGLGIAYQLEELHLPQMIVMREPVPDKIAQEFLKYFLESLSHGTSLYTSVRHARRILRELLQIDQEFPGASWLPVICQNPTAATFVWPSASPHQSWHQRIFKQFKQQNWFISGVIGGAIVFGLTRGNVLPAACPTETERQEAGICVKDLRKAPLVVGFLTSPHKRIDPQDQVYLGFESYLRQALGEKVRDIEIRFGNEVSYREIRRQLARKEFDIVFAYSPLNSSAAKENSYTWLGLGRKTPKDNISYRSVLFVRADSPIRSIADIQPRTKLALGYDGSASSFSQPIYDLHGKTLQVFPDNTHEEIHKLVKQGSADIGASIDGNIERNPEFRVIHRSREIPVGGIFMSPRLADTDRAKITHVFQQAPKEIQESVNYSPHPEMNYQAMGQIADRVEEIMKCANYFSHNPAQLFCPPRSQP
jgi:ABC-type phosphate/phosphonate transport system substrate-binding protein